MLMVRIFLTDEKYQNILTFIPIKGVAFLGKLGWLKVGCGASQALHYFRSG